MENPYGTDRGGEYIEVDNVEVVEELNVFYCINLVIFQPNIIVQLDAIHPKDEKVIYWTALHSIIKNHADL